MNIKRFLWWWGPVVVWCGIIFWLSSIPDLKINNGASDYWLRKTAHMVEFAGLFLVIYRALQRKASLWSWHMAVLSAILALLYAITDEIHQHFVPTRSGTWVDAIIDSVGIAVAFLGLWWWKWYERILSETNSGMAGLPEGENTGNNINHSPEDGNQR